MALADAVSSVVAVYPLDEASGDAIASVGGVNLTDTNTVGSGTGHTHATCRDIEFSNLEYFSASDNAVFSFADNDWTISFYINVEQVRAFNGIVGKWPSGGNLEYLIRHGGTSLQFFVSGDGTANTSVESTTFGALSTATWYSVCCVHDSVNNEIRIYINGTKDSAAHSGGTFNGTGSIYIGRDSAGGDSYDGLIEELVFTDGYAFTDADATEHYNSGNGKAYANWAAAGGQPTVKRMGGVRFAHSLGRGVW